MSSTNQPSQVASTMAKLSIDSSKQPGQKKPKAKKQVVDSWEDEDVSSDSEDNGSRPSTAHEAKEGTTAPPPTPISPNYHQAHSQPFANMSSLHSMPDTGASPTRRPEKTDAVARRMIASALGVKAPKATQEQKDYDKAMKDKERKRREEQRAADKQAEEEREKAKKAIWED